jgi:hypothetical protein
MTKALTESRILAIQIITFHTFGSTEMTFWFLRQQIKFTLWDVCMLQYLDNRCSDINDYIYFSYNELFNERVHSRSL